MEMKLSECAKIVQGTLVGEDVCFSSVSIDTRAIVETRLIASLLYIAIQGKNFDGNDFVDQAQQAGVIAAIVHKGVNTSLPHIVVDNTQLALAQLAGEWRKKLAVSVVGVTGSRSLNSTSTRVHSPAVHALAICADSEFGGL